MLKVRKIADLYFLMKLFKPAYNYYYIAKKDFQVRAKYGNILSYSAGRYLSVPTHTTLHFSQHISWCICDYYLSTVEADEAWPHYAAAVELTALAMFMLASTDPGAAAALSESFFFY